MGSSAPAAPRPPGGRTRVPVAVAAAVLALAGCGSGSGAQSNATYQPADGMTNRGSNVYALNMLLVSNGDGQAVLVGTLINQAQTTDRLTQWTVGKTPKDRLDGDLVSGGGVSLAPQQSVMLPGAEEIRVQSGEILPGDSVALTLGFARGASVVVNAPVVPNVGEYAEYITGGSAPEEFAPEPPHD